MTDRTDPPDCDRHEVSRLGYLAFHEDAARRYRKHENQRKCPACGRFVWASLFHKRGGAA